MLEIPPGIWPNKSDGSDNEEDHDMHLAPADNYPSAEAEEAHLRQE